MRPRITRPSPLSCAAAGALIAVGLVSIAARAVQEFTDFTIRPPFDVVAFVAAVLCTSAGGVYTGWLVTRNLKQQINALEAENHGLRTVHTALTDLVEAVRKADQQGEINSVRINKLTRLIERQNAEADTQPIATLHSIRGA